MHPQKVAGMIAVDSATSITAQMEAFTMKVDALAKGKVQLVTMVCELCAGAHATEQCAISAKSVNYVSNYSRPHAAATILPP